MQVLMLFIGGAVIAYLITQGLISLINKKGKRK